MFRASSARLQEDTVVHMQHMVLSLSMRLTIPYAAWGQEFDRSYYCWLMRTIWTWWWIGSLICGCHCTCLFPLVTIFTCSVDNEWQPNLCAAQTGYSTPGILLL